MPQTQLPRLLEETIRPEWVDYNGHMNVAYYVLVFDRTTDVFLPKIGMSEAFRQSTGSSTFAGEMHLTYLREVKEGDRVYITLRVLECDAKRMRLFYAMHDKKDDTLCATSEVMSLHVNLNDRRVSPFPDHVAAKIADFVRRQADLPWPPQAGRAVAIPRKQEKAARP